MKKFTGSTPFEKFVMSEFKKVNEAIKFIRVDTADMEDHLNGKIKQTEERLSRKITEETSKLESKIDPIGRRIDDLERIHPGGIHVSI